MAQPKKGSTSKKAVYDPPVICTYGPAGSGKTADCGLSFPNFLFIAGPGALQPIRQLGGYEPAQVQVNGIEEASRVIQQMEKSGDYEGVIVDDFSHMVEQTFAQLEGKYRSNKLGMWGELRKLTLNFRDLARNAGCTVVLNCWEKAPRNYDGKHQRGGPMLSGKLPEQLPALCDLVLRCGIEPMRKPWPGIYKCSLDPDYVMKDRFNICSRLGTVPMNLAEILRAAGIEVSRYKGLEWQEEIVEQVAQKIVSEGNDIMIANEFYRTLLSKEIDYRIARWTLRDAMDRAIIRRGLTATQQQFIV